MIIARANVTKIGPRQRREVSIQSSRNHMNCVDDDDDDDDEHDEHRLKWLHTYMDRKLRPNAIGYYLFSVKAEGCACKGKWFGKSVWE